MISTGERDRVIDNRQGYFLALGFLPWQAHVLAFETSIDWHYVRDQLILRGCDVETAFQIVKPELD